MSILAMADAAIRRLLRRPKPEGGIVPRKGPYIDMKVRTTLTDAERMRAILADGEGVVRVRGNVKRFHFEGDIKVIEEMEVTGISVGPREEKPRT